MMFSRVKLPLKFLATILSVLLFAGGPLPALADLANGTPLFTCTVPTQGINAIGTNVVLVPLPATGPTALKELHIYIDLPAASVTAGPGGNNFVTGTTPTKVVPAVNSAQCVWQTQLGDIASGNHTARASFADNSGQEGAVSNPLAFTVPVVIYKGPVAPVLAPVQ